MGYESGARVRNAYATCPVQGVSPEKSGLIPRTLNGGHPLLRKGASRGRRGMRAIS